MDEYNKAERRLKALMIDFLDNNPLYDAKDTIVYLSDDDELQSLMMWVCMNEQWNFERTEEETHVADE
jgi:hypothetical protein